jgi:AcrR family transcriptional regulator
MTIQWSCVSYDEDIARVVHHLLAEQGSQALTLPAVARAAKLSPGTLAYQFENKDLMIARCARVIGRLFVDDLVGRLGVGDVRTELAELVARNQYELADLKVWLDLAALGRTDARVGHHVREAGARFRALLGRRIDDDGALPGVDRMWADRMWLVLQAVWADQLTPGKELAPDEARSLVAELLSPDFRS